MYCSGSRSVCVHGILLARSPQSPKLEKLLAYKKQGLALGLVYTAGNEAVFLLAVLQRGCEANAAWWQIFRDWAST